LDLRSRARVSNGSSHSVIQTANRFGIARRTHRRAIIFRWRCPRGRLKQKRSYFARWRDTWQRGCCIPSRRMLAAQLPVTNVQPVQAQLMCRDETDLRKQRDVLKNHAVNAGRFDPSRFSKRIGASTLGRSLRFGLGHNCATRSQDCLATSQGTDCQSTITRWDEKH
jgi:hypothetical protein